MPRIRLIHWNAAEGKKRADFLRKGGHKVDIFSGPGGEAMRALRDKPPDAFVIDLNRLPSHGREVATALRQFKATRLVPIVFVGGEKDKVARARASLPDAAFTEWPQIRGALAEVIAHPPQAPLVPQMLNSSTPLPKRLGIKAGAVVALLGAPPGMDRTFGTLPENVRLRRRAWGRVDLMLLFTKSQADLEARFSDAVRNLAEDGGLWIIWPKQASKVDTDLTQSIVRDFGLKSGYVDSKISAIDAVWSGMLFLRDKNREPARK
ncbi:MAG: DUF3052 family protein [candidate division Zixibacteria bacterium]|nr:DUF3052 family protein [candidate division Zixibacteria bacterium]